MAICFDDPSLTLDEILLRHGLKATDLDKQCPLEVRNEVSVRIADWEMVARCFNFPSEKIRDIKSDNESQERCKIALLDTWSRREGKGATYLKLADVFHRRKRRDLVEFLCEKIKSSMHLVPLSGARNTSWDIASTVKPHPISIAEGYSDTVSSQIDSLKEQFDDIHSRLVTELSTNEGISVEQVLQTLTMLPFAFRKQYQDTIQNMLPNLETKDRISSLFHLLNPLFTFVDYELLKHLVSKFGSSELKDDMSVYTEKVKLFKKATTISELIEYWPGLEVPESNYSRLRAKIDDDPGTFTLEELDNFRRKFFSHLRLSNFVSASILMLLEHTNSFVAIWRIPTVVVPEIIEAFSQMDNTFSQVEHVLELSVDERTLHQKNVRLASMCTTSSVDESANMALVSAELHLEGGAVGKLPPQNTQLSHQKKKRRKERRNGERERKREVAKVEVPSQHTEDALYSLLVFSPALFRASGHIIYIAAYSAHDNAILKILKEQRTQSEHSVDMVVKRLNFRFNKKARDPCLKVLSKGNIKIQSGDGKIRPCDIWRESGHEVEHWLDHYHLRMTLSCPLSCSSIEFKGTTDDSQLKVKFKLDFDAHNLELSRLQLIVEDQSKRAQEPAKQNFVPYQDVHFGYHSTTGECIRIFSCNGLGAERTYPTEEPNDGVVYGTQPLKGVAKFEVEIISYRADCPGMSLGIGVMRCEKGVSIESLPSDPYDAVNHCLWNGQELYNNLVTPKEVSEYGYVNLGDLCERDRVGLRLSQDGVLEFTVNGESQGIAAKNVYTRDSDVYAVVDHRGNCVATVITKAVTQYESLQELCLTKLSKWLKSSKEVDTLPLPTRLKDKIKVFQCVTSCCSH